MTQTPGRFARRRHRRSIFWRARRVVYVFLLIGLLSISLVWRAVASIELPPARDADVSTVICDARVLEGKCDRANSVAQLASEQVRIPISYAAIPDVMIKSMVAAEDKAFFEHRGINPLGIGRALYQDIKSRSADQGGSTLTQQFIKVKYLTADRSVIRKIREAILAMKIEKSMTKEAILEEYLNLVPFGRRAYGVQAASIAFFGHTAETLTLSESTYLAVRVRAPNADDQAVIEKRRQALLRLMEREEFITPAQAEKSRKEPPNLIPAEDFNNLGSVPPDLRAAGYDYVMELVRQEAVERFGEDRVLRGGLRVYTTVNPEWQKVAYQTIYSKLPNPAADPDGALVTLDESGAVRAMVGGRDFSKGEVNLAMPKQTGGSGRPAGSTFKPIVLAQYVNEGFSLESTYDAPPLIEIPDANPDGTDWEVQNYHSNENTVNDRGILTVREATDDSVNTVYAQLMQKVGPDKVVEMAKQLGINGLDPVPSLVLGTGETQPIDMAAAYLTFANKGIYKRPYLIWRVEDSNGKPLYQVSGDPQYVPKRVIDEGVAKTVAFALRSVVERGSGANAALANTSAGGKTGTTQNYRDAWFVGFTCKFTTAVWLGYPDVSKSMTNIAGQETVTGSNLPAMMWGSYMRTVADNDPSCQFPSTDVGKTKEKGPVLPRISTTTSSTLPPADGSGTATTGGGDGTSGDSGSDDGSGATDAGTTQTTGPPSASTPG